MENPNARYEKQWIQFLLWALKVEIKYRTQHRSVSA